MLDQTELETFLTLFGKRAKPFIKILGDHQAFMSVIQTPIGTQILKDAVAGMQKAMSQAAHWDKIDEPKKERCLADMRAYKDICERWATIIEAYNESVKTIKDAIK